jgi:excisionase family DNA binding protein
MPKTEKKTSGFPELGVTGLKRSGGRILEEWVPELSGPRGMKVYREMQDNSPAVGGCLGSIEMLCRQVSWQVEPPSGASQEELRQADLVRTSFHDMSFSWSDTLSEILSMLGYGFSLLEAVYKERRGDVNDPARRSRHTDGLVGWRKLAIRSQETVQEWELDDTGGIRGFVQAAAPDYRRRPIPIEKVLLFRPKIAKNNPEGRSILRSAYRSYYYWKRILEIEGIGIERDLAGMPVMGIPAACFLADATPEQKATLAAAKEIVTSLRRDELEGAVIPLEYHPGTSNKMYDLSLLTTGGRRQFDTSAIISQRHREIVLSMIYDLLIMGEPNTLQYKGSKMPEFFAVSLGAWLDSITDVINTHGVPRLYRMNGWSTGRMARLEHGAVQVPDLSALGDYISKLVGAKALFPDGLDAYLRRLAGLPEREPSAAAPPPTTPSTAPAAAPEDEGGDGGDGAAAPPEPESGPTDGVDSGAAETQETELLSLVDRLVEGAPPLRVSEVAAAIGYSPRYVQKLLRNKAIQSVKMRGRRERRIPVSEVLRLRSELATASGAN